MPDSLVPGRGGATPWAMWRVVRPDYAIFNQPEPECSTRGRGVHPESVAAKDDGEYDDEAGRKNHFIRIDPTSISGRRFTVTPPPTWWSSLDDDTRRVGMTSRSPSQGLKPAGRRSSAGLSTIGC